MDENGEIRADAAEAISNASSVPDEAIDVSHSRAEALPDVLSDAVLDPFMNGEIRTLDGDIVGDEFAADAINYQILLRKIDLLLEKLKLDA